MSIIVKGLHPDLTNEILHALFEPFGEIISVNVMRDKMTGASRGFGFVNMKYPEDEFEATRDMDGRELGGNIISVSEANQRKTWSKDRDLPKPRRTFNDDFSGMDMTDDDDYSDRQFDARDIDISEDDQDEEVKDKSDFSTKKTGDGLVTVKFKK